MAENENPQDLGDYDAVPNAITRLQSGNEKKVADLLNSGMPQDALHGIAFQVRVKALIEELIRTGVVAEYTFDLVFERQLADVLDEVKENLSKARLAVNPDDIPEGLK